MRQYLQHNGLTAPHAFEYLRHDLHVQHILDYLLTETGGVLTDLYDAQCCEFTVIVYDRIQHRQLQAVDGELPGELPETGPLRILPKLHPIAANQALLCKCCLMEMHIAMGQDGIMNGSNHSR